jgi:hypothetical protein
VTTTLGTGARLMFNGVDVGVVTEWTLDINYDWDGGHRDGLYWTPVRTGDATAHTEEGYVRFRIPFLGETTINQAAQTVTIEGQLEALEVRLNTIRDNLPVPEPGNAFTGLRGILNAYNGTLTGTANWTARNGGPIDATTFGDTTRQYLYGYNGYIDPAAAKLAKKRAAERQAAEDKALALLRSHLDTKQRAMLKEKGYFHLKGEKIVYRIYQSGTVQTYKPHGTFCVYPVNPDGMDRTMELPGPDQALTIKLFIEADEAEFLRTANWSGAFPRSNFIFNLAKLDVSGTTAVQPEGGYQANVYGRRDIDGSSRRRRDDPMFDTYMQQLQQRMRDAVRDQFTGTVTTTTAEFMPELGTVGYTYDET